jgi:FKBP-type peptidyl-prolyl cis-trans isomerase 2
MELEKNVIIATIALLVIVSGVTGAYLYYHYVWKEEIVVESGDCVDVDYIGKFAVNDTIFDTSYEDVAKEANIYNANRTYVPLNIFINSETHTMPPDIYKNYTSNMIEGFKDALVGMKEGENKTAVIPPEKAYGIWNETMAEEMGVGFQPLDSVMNCTIEGNKSTFLMGFTNVNITINSTFDYGAVALGVEGVLNATILNVTDTNITYKLLPENGTNFVHPITGWNVTFIVENETAFKMHSDIKVNHTFSIMYYQQPIHFKVVNVNETTAKLAINMNAPEIKFIGQTLVFELKLVKLYKTSQLES